MDTALPTPVAAPVPLVYYTAIIVTVDGSDTTAGGEPCEPGHGYAVADGFWDPDRGYWRVHADRDQVTPDVYPAGDPRSRVRWLADRLTARLGSIEAADGRSFTSGREALHPGRLAGTRAQQPGAVIGGGTLLGDALAASRLRPPAVGLRTLTAAGHPYGFTDTELAHAARLLGAA
jgi:hypothetical protein